MKKICYFAFVLGIFITSCTGSTEETSTENDAENKTVDQDETSTEAEVKIIDGYHYYGIKELDPQGAISIEEMNAIVASSGSFEGKISAQLAGVCQTAGCWVTLENPGQEPMRVFFGAHDFFVPTNTAIGKEVILEGKTDIDTFTVEFQKHLLDDEVAAGNEVPQEKYDEIKEDKIETSFIASGILIKP